MSMSESPRQEADSGNGDAGKEVSCPTCGREDFASELGMKQHHSRAHGESIAYTQTECDYCGEEIEVQDRWMEEQENHFCDRECFGMSQRDRTEIACEICGERFKITPHQEDTASCCSEECRIEKTRRITGDERYNYKTQTYECQECEAEVERSPSMVYSEDRVFCGTNCFDEYRRGGYEQYYGKNWNQQRRAALERDQYRCQVCGDTSADLYREPDVHHIQPIGKYKDKYDEPEWWERGNQLDNLVTLCPEHHRKWEGIPLRPH